MACASGAARRIYEGVPDLRPRGPAASPDELDVGLELAPYEVRDALAELHRSHALDPLTSWCDA
jgi:hypothetical protein